VPAVRIDELNELLRHRTVCGWGGQALGLEMAGFHHEAAVEYEPHYCTTLRKNRPQWNVLQQDIRSFRCEDFSEIDLIAGGVPCPPLALQESNSAPTMSGICFPQPWRLLTRYVQGRAFRKCPRSRAVKFDSYRRALMSQFSKLGYQPEWKVLQASDLECRSFGPRFIPRGLAPGDAEYFEWPNPSVRLGRWGKTLVDLMEANGCQERRRGRAARLELRLLLLVIKEARRPDLAHARTTTMAAAWG